MFAFARPAALLRALLALPLLPPLHGADLLVDFNSSTQDGGPHHQSGYQAYTAGHEVANDFLAARSYSAFNTTVSLQVTWPDSLNNRSQQMIDRGSSNDANWTGQKIDLLTDFIGVDTRTGEGGRGNYNGVTGLPTRLVFHFAGLPPGPYSYRSYHHDTENMHTAFGVEYSTDGGLTYVPVGGTFRMTDSSPGGDPVSPQVYTGSGNQDPATLPSTVNFDLVAEAGKNVLVRYIPYPTSAGTNVQILGVNGIELRAGMPPDAPTDLQLSATAVARTAAEGTVIGQFTTADPTPGDTFTYTLAEGVGADNNADFTIQGNSLVVDRQLTVYHGGGTLSVRVRSTDANAGWHEKAFALQVLNDADGDGLDDAWELLHFQDLDELPGGDPDDDELDHAEEQQAGTLPLDPDTDGDGLSDGEEVKIHFTDPLKADTDDDGLTDGEEILTHFTQPKLTDSDGDGFNDALELAQGTDPNDGADFPAGLLPLRLSEIVASNDTGLRDGNGDRSDWIEIHNPNSQPVNLAGYRLTDSAGDPGRWVFPAVTIPAQGYLVVFASGNGAPDAEGKLHTGFSLSAGGEYLALSRADGTIEDSHTPKFPAQFPDISYGRRTSDGSLRFFSPPTPGTANGSGYEGVVEAPDFSMGRGFHDAPVDVVLSCSTPLAQIRYTTDGTKPSASAGILYPGGPLPMTTTGKLRAIAYRPGWLSRPVQTHSYIFVDDVAHQPANPPGWPDNWGYSSDAGAVVPSDYEMDPRVVNNTLPGYGIREALLDIPSVSINMPLADFINPPGGIYASPLNRVEKECSVEYLPVDGSEGFQADCKVEIQGNASRRPARMQKHSLRLTFSSEVGIPKLEYPLFPDSPVDKFNKLVLRACFSDSWGLVSWDAPRYRPNDAQYMRDVWMKRSFGAMGQPSSYGRYVHLYVNGLYFGLHDLCERLEDDFYAEHLGGEAEDWEVNADFASGGTRWNQMMAIANSSSISNSAGLQSIGEYLDLTNFADYMLLHFYADAEDWPHHNGYAAVNAVSGDGRFRFSVWDQEISLNKFTWNRYNSNNGNTTPGTLFQRLRLNPEFRLLFADRVKKHLHDGGALALAGSKSRYLGIAAEIDKAIVAESARWGDTADKTPYGSTIQQPYPLTNVDADAYPPAPHANDPGGIYFTREDSWLVERDHTVNYHMPLILSTTDGRGLIPELRANGLYPAIDAPTLSQHGGVLPPGQLLSITAPNGSIYYTTSGIDPRQPVTGNPSSGSVLYTGTFALPGAAIVKARARLSDGTWSALVEAEFEPGGVISQFKPGISSGWSFDDNWTNPPYPDSTAARARIMAPTSGDRNIDLTSPVTVREITFEQGNTSFRNRIRDEIGANPLSFESATGNAVVRVNGTGSGWAEFEFGSECILNSPLTLEVNNPTGNTEYGALRLRGIWMGTEGLTKTGPGIASLTGEDKLYSGPTVISQGVLKISQAAAMNWSSSVSVTPGGQLRLSSGGTASEPEIYSFGGPLHLDSSGRGGVTAGPGAGVEGGLRYEPGSGANHAALYNAVALDGPSVIHVEGSGNQLTLAGQFTGSGGWSKSGAGLLRLSGESLGFTAPAAVNDGTVELAGRTGSAFQIGGSAILRGHGRAGALSGSGTVLLDRTLLHASSASGLQAKLVFSLAGSPEWSQPAASINGTLILDSAASHPGSLHLYLDTSTLLPGDRFRGGLLLPGGSDWSGVLLSLPPVVFKPDPGGSHSFDNRTWSPVANVSLTRMPVSVNLGQGPVQAELMELRLDGSLTHFAAWQADRFSPAELGNPAISGENATPYGDGTPNLMRYALGAAEGERVQLPLFAKDGGSATFRFRYDPSLFDLIYQVEATDDLTDWSDPVVIFNSASTLLPPSPDGWLTVADPAPAPGRRFYRLRVSRLAE